MGGKECGRVCVCVCVCVCVFLRFFVTHRSKTSFRTFFGDKDDRCSQGSGTIGSFRLTKAMP